MNAKKIMGAVLVALLAAALFVGAGAAATVFVYETGVNAQLKGDWSSANGGLVVIDGDAGKLNVTPIGTFVPGVYENATGAKLSIIYPTATISGIAGNGAAAYPFIGANLYESSTVTITNVSASTVKPEGYLLTFPNTTTIFFKDTEINGVVNNLDVGTYKIAVQFNYTKFTIGTDVNLFKTTPVTFTVVEDGEATIAVSADQMIKGEVFTVTVTGQPGVKYLVNSTKNVFNITAGQSGITPLAVGDKHNVTFVMPNSGKISFTAEAATYAGKEETLNLFWWNTTGTPAWEDTDESVTVKFEKGTLTAKTEAASYFVGDVVKITGTTTAGALTSGKINGTNFYNTISVPSAGSLSGDTIKTFEFELPTSTLKDLSSNKKIDVGTYTITLYAGDASATIALVLKQPFISIAEAPEVIVQGEDAEFIINAEATGKIGYYIFGTNYFKGAIDVVAHPEDDEGEDIENQFLIELDGDDVTSKMAAGQYFAVFQHPMYDQAFNVSPSTTDAWTINVNSEYTIVVKDRQTANAAQALCDALDAQGIDDMYAKASFFIVGKDASFTISEIPTTVAQGETITISGVSTAAAEDYVTVEMISTAFAAVPKETVGSAAFIVVTTQVAEDGTWEVTLDTSDLNVDEYSLKVACEGTTWKNVNVNVVEGADTPDTPDTPDVPDTPDTPDTPTEPETPGFGALAALAGLGAVAVLLLRRE